MSNRTRPWRPSRPHAVLCEMVEHINAAGSHYYVGNAGQCQFLVTEIRNPDPGSRATHVLQIAETDWTRRHAGVVSMQEAFDGECEE
jgi:hypothetical protein